MVLDLVALGFRSRHSYVQLFLVFSTTFLAGSPTIALDSVCLRSQAASALKRLATKTPSAPLPGRIVNPKYV